MEGYKLFSVRPGGDPAEIAFENDQNEIVIGGEGRGRRATTIPVVGEGAFFRPKQAGESVVLVRVGAEATAPARCLVVVNTVGGYDRSRNYGLFDVKDVKAIAEGWCAFGAAGRTNGGPVVLAIAEPGAEFRLNSKYASHWYRWNGEAWIYETPSRRAARLALEEVEAGGGEWL